MFKVWQRLKSPRSRILLQGKRGKITITAVAKKPYSIKNATFFWKS